MSESTTPVVVDEALDELLGAEQSDAGQEESGTRTRTRTPMFSWNDIASIQQFVGLYDQADASQHAIFAEVVGSNSPSADALDAAESAYPSAGAVSAYRLFANCADQAMSKGGMDWRVATQVMSTLSELDAAMMRHMVRITNAITGSSLPARPRKPIKATELMDVMVSGLEAKKGDSETEETLVWLTELFETWPGDRS